MTDELTTDPKLLRLLEELAGYEMSDEEVAAQRKSFAESYAGGPSSVVVVPTPAPDGQKRDFHDTLSAFSVVKEEFFPAAPQGAPETPKMAPVQGFTDGIPWEMHMRAYDAYCKRYGKQQALIENGCRGGFGTEELDGYIPGWRLKLSDPRVSLSTIAQLEAHLEDAQDLNDIRWAKIEVLEEQLATARNEALEEALQSVQLGYLPIEYVAGGDNADSYREGRQDAIAAIRALKTKEPTNDTTPTTTD